MLILILKNSYLSILYFKIKKEKIQTSNLKMLVEDQAYEIISNESNLPNSQAKLECLKLINLAS